MNVLYAVLYTLYSIRCTLATVYASAVTVRKTLSETCFLRTAFKISYECYHALPHASHVAS